MAPLGLRTLGTDSNGWISGSDNNDHIIGLDRMDVLSGPRRRRYLRGSGHGIARIDGSSGMVVALSAQAVKSMTDENNTPHLNGDADDVVKASESTRQNDAIQAYERVRLRCLRILARAAMDRNRCHGQCGLEASRAEPVYSSMPPTEERPTG